MFKQIVVANDGSDGGRRALEFACDLANLHRAALHMISVEELPYFPASIDEVIETKEAENHKFHAVLETARKLAEAKGMALQAEVVAGHAVATIDERVKALKADLLVVGFMCHSTLS